MTSPLDSPTNPESPPDNDLPTTTDSGKRAELITAEMSRERGSRVQVRVILSCEGAEYAAEVSGVGEEVLLLRLAAKATISALEEMIGRPGHFELVGIKSMHAFDAPVVLACLRTKKDRSIRLIGCVAGPENLVHGVVTAVLDATNRHIGGLAEDSGEDESTGDAD